jgi:uncharacterized protein YecE (DUF72 family)
MARPRDIRIGVSGWTYRPWRGNFYPKGLAQKNELRHVAHTFNAIEINGSFYSLQRPSSYATWDAATPEGFVFAVKGSRYLTHMLKLKNAEVPLANFFASGPLRLGEKLGPILWQFPESFRFDLDRLEAFFELLPRAGGEAAALASRHDSRMKHGVFTNPNGVSAIRHAIEIRHESFRDPAFIRLLKKHDIALVCADTVRWPLLMDLTADFVYCRLHGNTELYNSRYREDELDQWAERLRAWSEGKPMRDGNFVAAPEAHPRARDVYLFFDNTDKLHAPGDARKLMRRLGITWPRPVSLAA